jgi:hypothetical protein
MSEDIFKTILWCTVLLVVIRVTLGYEVLYAMNMGSNGEQIDSNGLVYQATNCSPFSSCSTNIVVGTLEQNVPIYQSYCCAETITFEMPILDMKNGSYLLVLRLIEMGGDANRVSVQFNGHKHLEHFSFYNVVGNRHAYDEHIYFSICDEQVLYKSAKSAVQGNKLRITMESSPEYFARLSAMVLVRGDVENFPKLASSPNSAESESSKMALTTHRCGNDNNINKNITSIINHGTMNINIHIN